MAEHSVTFIRESARAVLYAEVLQWLREEPVPRVLDKLRRGALDAHAAATEAARRLEEPK